jgi:hypothetical protein
MERKVKSEGGKINVLRQKSMSGGRFEAIYNSRVWPCEYVVSLAVWFGQKEPPVMDRVLPQFHMHKFDLFRNAEFI